MPMSQLVLTTRVRLTTAGRAHCWGDNSGGQLGDGSLKSSLVPVPVAGGFAFKSIHAGWKHSCGLTVTGEALCWGVIIPGQLELPPTPFDFTPGRRYTQLGSAGSFVCGLAEDYDLICWGSIWVSNSFFPLAAAPLTVASGLSDHSIAIGMANVCVVSTAGVTRCWLGDDVFPVGMFGPLDIGPSPSFTALATGTNPLCGVTNSDRVFCWWTTVLWRINGDRDSGIAPMTDPIEVPDLLAVSISRSFTKFADFACALTRRPNSGHGVACWGVNFSGQLGNGTTTQQELPTEVIFP